jgi:hypothetical protein
MKSGGIGLNIRLYLWKNVSAGGIIQNPVAEIVTMAAVTSNYG